MDHQAQKNSKTLDTNPSIDNKDDDEGSDDNPEIPPLETIDKEMNSMPDNKKNIVIPEDKESDVEGEIVNDDGYIDILNNGDLRKKIIKKGDSSIRPQRGGKVVIRLETRIYEVGDDDKDIGMGTLIDAETFDRFTLVLGDNDLYQGLDLLIPLMELHEVSRAIIKSRFAYGLIGNKSIGIPEDATLDCTIELLEIFAQNDNIYGEDDENTESTNKESLDERLKFGSYKKSRGNFWFERAEYSLAIQCYRGALKYLDANSEELKLIDQNDKEDDNIKESSKKVEDLIDKRAQTFNNLAAAQMKLEAYDSALRSVKDSLLLRPNNVKALFRQAKIMVEKNNIEEAIKELKKAASIDPKSEAVALELDRLNKILAKQLRDQKALYRRMMQVKDDPKQNKNSKQSVNQCDSTQQHKSIWSRLRWPVISLGVVTVGAILIQAYFFVK